MKHAGVLLELDRGDGQLARLPLSEIGPSVSIEGSLDGYGRTMTFDRIDAKQSPYLYAFLKSLRSVRARGYFGEPGDVASEDLFLGAIRQGEFNALPPTAHIECQDYSAQFRNIPFYFQLAPGKRVSRTEAWCRIVEEYRIPYDLDSHDFGNNDGGWIVKGINHAGDVMLLDFLHDFLQPIGRRFFFRADGYMEVFRIDETAAPSVTLKAADIISSRVLPPAVDDMNAVSVSAMCYPYTGPTGTRRTVVTEYVYGDYTPVAAVQKQDKTTGAITSVSPSVTASTIVSKKVTSTDWDGGSILYRLIEEYEFYAPLACPNQQDAAGVVTWNHGFDVYIYADGTYRTDDQESLRVVRRTLLLHNFYTANKLTDVWELTARYQQIEMPTKSVDAAGAEHFIAGFLTASGNSWWAGREFVDLDVSTAFSGLVGTDFTLHDLESYTTAYETRTREQSVITEIRRTFGFNGEQEITSESVEFYLYCRYTYTDQGTSAPAPPTLSWKFAAGRIGASAHYATQVDAGSFQFVKLGSTATTSRTAYDGLTYVQSMGYATTKVESIFFVTNDIYFLTAEDFIHFYIGGYLPLPIPSAIYKTSVQVPTLHHQTSFDDVRIALVGNTFVEQLQHDHCETDDELLVVAQERLRELSALKPSIETFLNLDIVEGSPIGVTIQEISGEQVTIIAKGVQHLINGSDCRTIIDGRYYPPELEFAVA